jgi:hypothetical protein
MEKTFVKTYLNHACRFRLKSGKTVYGVIWEVNSGESTNYYFASIHDHNLLLKDSDFQSLSNRLVPIDLNDIVGAERLVG